jgi:hypothetical protein
MKKILFSASFLMVLASCEEPNVKPKSTKYRIGKVSGHEIQVYEFEGCEYFYFEYDRSASLTHKGNCNNPIHSFKQQEQ